jgi:competence protein ComEC
VLRCAPRPTRAWPGVGEIVAIAGRVAPLGRFDAFQASARCAAAASRSRVPRHRRAPGRAGRGRDAARRRAETGLGARARADPEAALLRGMVLGQDEQLGDDVRDDFKRSGLATCSRSAGRT